MSLLIAAIVTRGRRKGVTFDTIVSSGMWPVVRKAQIETTSSVDLWRLGQLYRVASFVGLAAVLIMVSFLYQRFMTGKDEEESAGSINNFDMEEANSKI